MRRQRAAVGPALGGRGGALGWIGLLGLRGLGGFPLLHIFQAQLQLVQRQGLGPAAEAVTLHLLQDLGQPIGPRPLGQDHRLERGRIVREAVDEGRHGPDYSTSAAS